MKMSLAEIAKAIRVQNDIAKWQDLEVTNVAFDSRALEAGALFIPLMGEQDGHKYVANAFENGAVAADLCRCCSPINGINRAAGSRGRLSKGAVVTAR